MTAPALTFRDATPDDTALVAEYLRQLWAAHDAPDAENPSRILARAEECIRIGGALIVELGTQPVGYAALVDMGDHMFIRHFVVDESHRGGGFGRAVYEALAAARFPNRRARLTASLAVPGPKAFWEKTGFKPFAYAMQRDPEGTA